MNNQLILRLYKNSRGAVIGDLYQGAKRLLATAHPATIAAAIFAMDEYSFYFNSGKGIGEFAFPVDTGELDALGCLIEDQAGGDFMSGLATFSRFDFANPAPWDTQADIHFRTAATHLPAMLLKVLPAEPAPKSFKKELRNRNKYVYFPNC
jgi:hypothetical protein